MVVYWRQWSLLTEPLYNIVTTSTETSCTLIRTVVQDLGVFICTYKHVCMCVCMYIQYVCMCVCMYIQYVCVCVYGLCVCMYECMYVCMCVCVCVCMCVCMYVCICMYVCMYVCVYVCMYVCMYVFCLYVCIDKYKQYSSTSTIS